MLSNTLLFLLEKYKVSNYWKQYTQHFLVGTIAYKTHLKQLHFLLVIYWNQSDSHIFQQKLQCICNIYFLNFNEMLTNGIGTIGSWCFVEQISHNGRDSS